MPPIIQEKHNPIDACPLRPPQGSTNRLVSDGRSPTVLRGHWRSRKQVMGIRMARFMVGWKHTSQGARGPLESEMG